MIRYHRKIVGAALMLVLCITGMPVYGETDVAVGGIRMDRQSNVDAFPGDVSDELEEKVAPQESDKERDLETIIAPIPSREPLLGWTLSVPVMLMYRPPGSDPANQVWMSGVFGFYAENDSWGAGAFQRISFGGDAWRLKGALFHADLNYDYYGIGSDGGDESIPLSQPIDVISAEALRRVWPNLYVGLKAVYSETEVTANIPPELLPPPITPGDLTVDFTLASLNPRVQYDTRNSEFYPSKGWFIDLNMPIAREWIGSDLDYEKLELAVNYYYAVNEADVWASRVATKFVDNNAPFFMYPAFGQGPDLRGYQTGTYRDRFLFAAQTEYRHRFTPRIGAVAFVGVGTVDEDLLGWSKTLWSVGTGFRYVLAPKNDVSLRFDVARGRDEWVYYVNIGEAF